MTDTKNPVLPPLAWHESPNQSPRQAGVVPYLIVNHRPVGEYIGSIYHLLNPKSEASAHWISEGNFTKADQATQLVAWHRKAWACEAFNSISYNLEVDDDAWDGKDKEIRLVAARMNAFICFKTGIPVRWTKDPLHHPGITRHFDLGRAGGGHTDPTTSDALWRQFIREVDTQWHRGGFRRTYGKGRFQKIKL